jgi:hypothetical protein
LHYKIRFRRKALVLKELVTDEVSIHVALGEKRNKRNTWIREVLLMLYYIDSVQPCDPRWGQLDLHFQYESAIL